MKVSFTNKDTETVNRRWLWLIIGIYAVLLCVVGTFVGLFFYMRSSKTDAENELGSCLILSDDLASQNKILGAEIQRLDTENAALTTEYATLTEANTKLEANVKVMEQVLNSLKSKISGYTKGRNICLIAGGISLLANLYVVPYSLYQLVTYNTLREDVDYYRSHFYAGAAHTMETMLANEDGKILNFNLIYRRVGPTPNKAEFYNAVKGKGPTLTIIYGEPDEVIGFVMHRSWDTNTEFIDDSTSYTLSFRKNTVAKIMPNKHAVNTKAAFLEFGGGEIVVNMLGDGIAKTKVGFEPVENPLQDPANFYVESGWFDLSAIEVYTWTIA